VAPVTYWMQFGNVLDKVRSEVDKVKSSSIAVDHLRALSSC